MTSREIAELTGKQHKHVMRDIQTMIEQSVIDGSNFGPIFFEDKYGRKQPAFSLDFKATMTLVTGYDAKRRAAVIDRWMKLETGEVAPACASSAPQKELSRLEIPPCPMFNIARSSSRHYKGGVKRYPLQTPGGAQEWPTGCKVFR